MTDQAHSQPQHHTVAMRPIVHPLPMPDAIGIADRRNDAVGMTADLPLLVDTGWYDTYWYAEAKVARWPVLAEAARWIWVRLPAVLRVPTRSAREDDCDLVVQRARI